MGQLISSHKPSPAPSVVSGLSLTSSTGSSLAPSESVSQRAASIRSDPKPNRVQLPQASHPQPTLQIPPSVEGSRDVSPATESIVTVDEEDEGPIETTGFDLEKTLGGIPPPFVIEIKMPDPLPGHLHTMKRRTDLGTHDYTGLKGAERQREKRKQEGLKISALRPCDQPVAKLAIDRMDVLLACCCAFPDDETTWIIANMANVYACKKLGRDYALTRGSEYQKLVSILHHSIYIFLLISFLSSTRASHSLGGSLSSLSVPKGSQGTTSLELAGTLTH
jgi:hypothetical protein